MAVVHGAVELALPGKMGGCVEGRIALPHPHLAPMVGPGALGPIPALPDG